MEFGKSIRRRSRRQAGGPTVFDRVARGALDFAPTARKRPVPSLLRALREIARGYWLRLLLVTIAISVSTALRLAHPASPKFAIDYVLLDTPGPRGIPHWLGLPHDRLSLLIILAGVVLAFELVALTLDVWGRYRFKVVSWQIQIRFSRRILDRGLRLPLPKLWGIRGGGMTSLLREDARAPTDVLFQFVFSLWRSVLQLTGTLAVLATVDLTLLLAALTLLPMIWFSHKNLVAGLRPLFGAARRTRQDVDASVAEAVAAVRTVRAFQGERSVVARFVGGSHSMVRLVLTAWWRSTFVEIAWRALITLTSLAVLIYGGTRVLAGKLTLGDLMMFLGYVAMLMRPLENLVSGAMRLQDDLAGVGRSLDVIEEDPELLGASGAKTLSRERVRGALRFEQVEYSYPGQNRPAVTGLDLELHPGETLALVGPRGAGKTTVINLLERFCDPSAGRILLDGTDVRDLKVASYRHLIGLVDQEATLFDGTVRDNIAFGAKGVVEHEIEAAAQQANALEFIRMLPDGFDTVIGERGLRLSGGQRQAIALARALHRKPRILLLDEATNQLDGESEALMLKSVQALGKDCVRVLASHRLSTIRACDRVVMLEEGRIVEQGKHEVLLARGGRYAEFLASQLAAAESPPLGRAASS